MELYGLLCRMTAVCLISLTCCAPLRSGAQNRDSSAGNELLLSGDQTVTTATKKAQRVSDVPSAVTVITEEDIRVSGATTIPDLLRSVPGVDVMSPNQSQANVSIRGFNQQFANKLLVMVNGRSIYEDFFGGVFWNTDPILLSRIKRIEIVRGPGSALYGANAFNGVINIITKTPEEMAASRTNASAFSFLGGHDSNFTETLISGGKASDWAFAFGAGYHKTDGYGERQANQVRDSYSTPIFTADVQKKVKRGNWRFTADNADATADLTAFFFLSDADWHTSSYRLDYSEEGVRSPMMARLFGNFLRLNEKAHPDLKSSTYDFELQQQRDLSAKHNVVYGGNYRNVWIKARLMGDQEHSQDLWSLYLQDEFKAAPQTSLFAGVRLDSHSLYGTNITPRASLVHHLPKEQTLRLSYGTAFRAPTLVDSYFDYTYPVAPGVNGHISGNTDLKPEKVTSIEAGYRKEMRGGYVGLNLFHNRVTDLIETIPTQFAPSPPFPPGVPLQYSTINGRDARAVGFEMESEFHFTKGLRGLFNYSYQDVVDSTHQTVDFSPRNKINFGVMTDLANQFNAYLGAHYVDATVYHMSGQTFSVSPYTRIDARVGYRVGRADHPWNMSLAATNLLNDGHLEFPSASIPGVGVQGIAQSRTYWFMINGKL